LIFTGPGAVVQSVAEQDGAGLLDLETRRFMEKETNPAEKAAWFKKRSGTVVRSTLRAVPATVPDPFFEPQLAGTGTAAGPARRYFGFYLFNIAHGADDRVGLLKL